MNSKLNSFMPSWVIDIKERILSPDFLSEDNPTNTEVYEELCMSSFFESAPELLGDDERMDFFKFLQDHIEKFTPCQQALVMMLAEYIQSGKTQESLNAASNNMLNNMMERVWFLKKSEEIDKIVREVTSDLFQVGVDHASPEVVDTLVQTIFECLHKFQGSTHHFIRIFPVLGSKINQELRALENSFDVFIFPLPSDKTDIINRLIYVEQLHHLRVTDNEDLRNSFLLKLAYFFDRIIQASGDEVVSQTHTTLLDLMEDFNRQFYFRFFQCTFLKFFQSFQEKHEQLLAQEFRRINKGSTSLKLCFLGLLDRWIFQGEPRVLVELHLKFPEVCARLADVFSEKTRNHMFLTSFSWFRKLLSKEFSSNLRFSDNSIQLVRKNSSPMPRVLADPDRAAMLAGHLRRDPKTIQKLLLVYFVVADRWEAVPQLSQLETLKCATVAAIKYRKQCLSQVASNVLLEIWDQHVHEIIPLPYLDEILSESYEEMENVLSQRKALLSAAAIPTSA